LSRSSSSVSFAFGQMKVWLVICLVALVACNRAPKDPFDALMEELPYHGFNSYGFVPLQLPSMATPDSLIREMERSGRFYRSGISTFTNRETRSVHTKLRERDLQYLRKHDALNGWHPEYFTAVLLDTDAGRKILLLRHLGVDKGWFYRLYDSK